MMALPLRYCFRVACSTLMRAPILAATALAVAAPQPPAVPDYDRAERAVLAAELDRARAGRECVDPESLPAGVFPTWVAVSPWNGPQGSAGWASNVVELMPLDAAWREARAGRVAVRCVIV